METEEDLLHGPEPLLVNPAFPGLDRVQLVTLVAVPCMSPERGGEEASRLYIQRIRVWVGVAQITGSEEEEADGHSGVRQALKCLGPPIDSHLRVERCDGARVAPSARAAGQLDLPRRHKRVAVREWRVCGCGRGVSSSSSGGARPVTTHSRGGLLLTQTRVVVPPLGRIRQGVHCLRAKSV
jgi:hypothetical protein